MQESGPLAGRIEREFAIIFSAILSDAELARTASRRSVATQRYIEQVIDASKRALDLLELRLDHAERLQAMGAVTGGIAHDFNNILGAILGYAEMAHTASGRSVVTRQHIEHVINASHRARRIIEKIVGMGRKHERLVHPINLRQVVDQSCSQLRIELAQSLELNVRGHRKAHVIEGNPIEIQQILLDLCKNAADALGGTGQIDIDVGRTTLKHVKRLHFCQVPPGDYVTLSVRDNGSGIPDDVLPHIFEAFFTTKSQSGGTGLGLAFVLDHVNALGGLIGVTSHKNRGTRFEIYLPSSSQKAVELSLLYPSKKAPLGNGEIIAIMETDPAVLAAYEDKIAALGYEPIGFQSFEAFKAWMEDNNAPDLVMLDVSWGLNQLIFYLNEGIAKIPVVVIGGRADHSFGLESASASLLKKPFSIEELAEVLGRLCRNISKAYDIRL